MKKNIEVRKAIESKATRSAWMKGVKEYALEIMDQIEERSEWEGEEPCNVRFLEDYALNGASDWTQYSEGGCSLIYDRQIAERLCTKTELKITKNGEKEPNKRESWLDVQARALYQAFNMIKEEYTRC